MVFILRSESLFRWQTTAWDMVKVTAPGPVARRAALLRYSSVTRSGSPTLPRYSSLRTGTSTPSPHQTGPTWTGWRRRSSWTQARRKRTLWMTLLCWSTSRVVDILPTSSVMTMLSHIKTSLRWDNSTNNFHHWPSTLRMVSRSRVTTPRWIHGLCCLHTMSKNSWRRYSIISKSISGMRRWPTLPTPCWSPTSCSSCPWWCSSTGTVPTVKPGVRSMRRRMTWSKSWS